MGLFNLYGNKVPASSQSGSTYILASPFQSTVAGNVVGIRWYRAGAVDGNGVVGALWRVSDTVCLASKLFSGMTSSGWQQQLFDTPVPILANTSYVFGCGVTGGTVQCYEASAAISATFVNPLKRNASDDRYVFGTVPTYPSNVHSNWGANDVIFDDLGNLVLPDMVAAPDMTSQGVAGWLKQIGSMEDPLRVGVRKELVEGYPTPPCMAIDIPSTWRFRWGVKMGTRTIAISTKQVSDVAGKRPRLRVIANPEIGVNADVVGDAPAGTDWVTIGPLTVTPTSDGVLWVELENRDTDNFNSTAYFDHRILT